MEYNDVVIEKNTGWHRVILSNERAQNKLTPHVVEALFSALSDCENDPTAKAFVLEGTGEYFCNGMDLVAASRGHDVRGAGGDRFIQLLKKITQSSVVVISKVDGKSAGGGVGLVAASDFVFASERSQFSLPEILWGLVPCTIAPFLIRRVGFRVCQSMTLSTLSLSAHKALKCGLVDSLDEQALPKLLHRLRVVAPEAIGRAKKYLSKVWLLDDEILDMALNELDLILKSPEVKQRLTDFAKTKRYPWEKKTPASNGSSSHMIKEG